MTTIISPNTGTIQRDPRTDEVHTRLCFEVHNLFDGKAICKRAVSRLHTIDGYDVVVLLLTNQTSHDFKLGASAGGFESVICRWLSIFLYDKGRGLVYQKKVHYIPDVSMDPYYHPVNETGALVVVPLLNGEMLQGVLIVHSKAPNRFQQADINRLYLTACHIAISLANADRNTGQGNGLVETGNHQHRREIEALYTASSVLIKTLDLQSVLSQILDAVESAIPEAEKSVLHLLTHDTGQLKIRALYGFTDLRIRPFSKNGNKVTIGKAIRERIPLIINDLAVESESSSDQFIPELSSIKSIIVAPLVLGEEVLGALWLGAYHTNAFTGSNLKLLMTFAATATQAINNAFLQAESQKVAAIDPQIGICNYLGLFDIGQNEVLRAQRFKHPLSVLWLDVDHFTEINEAHGQIIGNQILKSLAEQCKKYIRSIDILALYGGDEFVILLLETDLKNALRVAERLRIGIADSRIAIDDIQVKMTLSVGVSELTPETTSLMELLDRGNKAMYAAKQAGRNCVISK